MTDLPGCGDTAFPAIVKLDEDRFLVGNYANSLEHTNWSWIRGQLNPTQLHFIEIVLSNS